MKYRTEKYKRRRNKIEKNRNLNKRKKTNNELHANTKHRKYKLHDTENINAKTLNEDFTK